MIRVEPSSGARRGEEAYVLYLDDVELAKSQASVFDTEARFWIDVHAPELYQRISEHTLGELANYVGALNLKLPAEITSPAADFLFSRPEEEEQEEEETKVWWELAFRIEFNVDEWKAPWSISEYVREMHKVVESSQVEEAYFDMYSDDQASDGFTVNFVVDELSVTIGQIVDRWVSVLREFEQRATNNLAAQIRADSVVALFDFPDAVRVPCEQYLLYFIQFLRDLGVDAKAELHHSAGTVLFSVTPLDPREALWRIREALNVFLKIPMAPDFDSYAAGTTDIQTQQLFANVQHLRGQLSLASAMLQYKDATIYQLQLTIEEQRRLISGEVIADSLIGTNEPEELLGGSIALAKHSIWGLELNWAQMFRHLKQLFVKEDTEGEKEGTEGERSS